jgi:hypothetical protein
VFPAVALILFLWLAFAPFVVWRSTHYVFTTKQVLFREGVEAERVPRIVGNRRILDCLIGHQRVVAGDDVFELVAPHFIEGLDDCVAERGVRESRIARPHAAPQGAPHNLLVVGDLLLVGWYTDRGFHFYAADLRAVGSGGPGAPEGDRPAGELSRYFACLDAAVTHLRAADAIDTVVVSAHAAGGIGAVRTEGLNNNAGEYRNDAYGKTPHKITLDVQGGIGEIELIQEP